MMPDDSITTLSDISVNNIQFDEYLKWNGESFVPVGPNGGRCTLPNFNFTKTNVKDASSKHALIQLQNICYWII